MFMSFIITSHLVPVQVFLHGFTFLLASTSTTKYGNMLPCLPYFMLKKQTRITKCVRFVQPRSDSDFRASYAFKVCRLTNNV
ncbi:hypothetical protein BT69DRAFT_803601 [Atractiella rhizophila]|nr:hypothetical protein BT69DRAFT_803601 [Atractiella rhizophila]